MVETTIAMSVAMTCGMERQRCVENDASGSRFVLGRRGQTTTASPDVM